MARSASPLEEVVVRGRSQASELRYQASLQDLPIAGGGTVAEQLALGPNISLAGQGGRLQTFALRGLGGSRLRVLLDDVPLRGLRRAGVAAELVQPDWLQVDATAALQGSRHGLSAGGGVVSLRSELPASAEIVAGLESNGQQRRLAFAGRRAASGALGEIGYTVNLGEAGDARAPGGARLNSGFRERGVSVAHRKDLGDVEHLTTLRWVQGDDWGKSNQDFPERRTDYPALSHLFLSHRAVLPGTLRLTGWVHEQKLRTRVLELDASANNRTEALDYGLRLQGTGQWGAWQSDFGLDHLARRNFEVAALADGAPTALHLEGGADLETGLYLNLGRDLGNWQSEFGVRITRTAAQAEGFGARSELLWSADAGLTWQPSRRGLLFLRSGIAHTAPTLSQRYFTGVTGRGTNVANPELRSERMLGADFGASLHTPIGALDLSAYWLSLTRGIERLLIDENTEQFVNVAQRDLFGGHLGLSLIDRQQLQLTLVMQWHQDPRRDDTALQQVPTLSGGLRLVRQIGTHWRVDWQGSFARGQRSQDRIRRVAGHFVYDAAVAYQARRWSVSLFARNVADREYQQSHDRKAALAPGRSAGVELRWRGS